MRDYYRVEADINLDYIYDNIESLKKNLHKNTAIMVVIKADGYGHGAVAVARTVDNLANYYGVAIVEEAIELRKAGITKPILILGASDVRQYDEIVQYDITQTMFRYDMAEKLNEIAKEYNKQVRVHIKVDTGMSRIGLKDDVESVKCVMDMMKLSNIEVEGIFTNFACADFKDKQSASIQLERFNRFVKMLEERGINIAIKHVSNSAAIIDMPEANLDMVRSGISIYGYYPSDKVRMDNVELKPAMSIKSHISFIKVVGEGTPVSYGSTFITKRATKIATIPVGYADGYPRQLSSKGRVLIRGQFAPIIGRVCMDQFMVDVTDIQHVKEHEEVILLGRDQDKVITVEELAELSGSFINEFICDVSKRIPRVYYRNSEKIGSFDYFDYVYKALDKTIL